MENDLGFANIYQRARTDLSERGLHWLKTLLKYRVPPGRVLELGSAHGGFVAALKWAGFDSSGLELSPAIAQIARILFDVRMLVGPVEDQKIPSGSLDVIALMDVLEHLPDPVATMRHCIDLLTPDGFLLVHTKFPRPFVR
jgi:SAM-dependent methyltransferase